MNSSTISNKKIRKGEEILGKYIRENIFNYIQSKYPNFTQESIISLDELNSFRREYLTMLVSDEKTDIKNLDSKVMNDIEFNEKASEEVEEEDINLLTFGNKLSDKIASFGGSWGFIISFFMFILLWMIINIVFLQKRAYDPYPFILLNLILSCIAAIQAPIIMMSQNRQEVKDRKRSEHDYKINLKAELEIKILSEKMDHLLVHQNKKLLEIQEIQADYLEDLIASIKK